MEEECSWVYTSLVPRLSTDQFVRGWKGKVLSTPTVTNGRWSENEASLHPVFPTVSGENEDEMSKSVKHTLDKQLSGSSNNLYVCVQVQSHNR